MKINLITASHQLSSGEHKRHRTGSQGTHAALSPVHARQQRRLVTNVPIYENMAQTVISTKRSMMRPVLLRDRCVRQFTAKTLLLTSSCVYDTACMPRVCVRAGKVPQTRWVFLHCLHDATSPQMPTDSAHRAMFRVHTAARRFAVAARAYHKNVRLCTQFT